MRRLFIVAFALTVALGCGRVGNEARQLTDAMLGPNVAFELPVGADHVAEWSGPLTYGKYELRIRAKALGQYRVLKVNHRLKTEPGSDGAKNLYRHKGETQIFELVSDDGVLGEVHVQVEHSFKAMRDAGQVTRGANVDRTRATFLRLTYGLQLFDDDEGGFTIRATSTGNVNVKQLRVVLASAEAL